MQTQEIPRLNPRISMAPSVMSYHSARRSSAMSPHVVLYQNIVRLSHSSIPEAQRENAFRARTMSGVSELSIGAVSGLRLNHLHGNNSHSTKSTYVKRSDSNQSKVENIGRHRSNDRRKNSHQLEISH